MNNYAYIRSYEREARQLQECIAFVTKKLHRAECWERALREAALHRRRHQQISLKRGQLQHKFLHQLRVTSVAGVVCAYETYVERWQRHRSLLLSRLVALQQAYVYILKTRLHLERGPVSSSHSE